MSTTQQQEESPEPRAIFSRCASALETKYSAPTYVTSDIIIIVVEPPRSRERERAPHYAAHSLRISKGHLNARCVFFSASLKVVVAVYDPRASMPVGHSEGGMSKM